MLQVASECFGLLEEKRGLSVEGSEEKNTPAPARYTLLHLPIKKPPVFLAFLHFNLSIMTLGDHIWNHVHDLWHLHTFEWKEGMIFFLIHVTSHASVFGATALKEDPTPKDKSVLYKYWERKGKKMRRKHAIIYSMYQLLENAVRCGSIVCQF